MLNLGLWKVKKNKNKLKTKNHKREMYLQKCNEILSVVFARGFSMATPADLFSLKKSSIRKNGTHYLKQL